MNYICAPMLRIKKLHVLFLKTFIGPFILTFCITLFILVMQFLWKYIDEMVGKGLEWYIIVELLYYASANLVPMALPLAILLSSIMTLGNLGEHYELAACKSAGLSLPRVMMPLIVFVLFISAGAFLFSNYAWPVANLKFATLLYDIRHKKPAIDIKEGIFYKEIQGIVIRVGKKVDNGKKLMDIIIYDHSDNKGNRKVIRAESGRMNISNDDRYLLFYLFNGYSYDESDGSKLPLFQSTFKEELMRFDLAEFKLTRSDEEAFKDNYKMLNIIQLNEAIDTLLFKEEQRKEFYNERMKNSYQITARDTFEIAQVDSLPSKKKHFFTSLDKHSKLEILEQALVVARRNKTYATSMVQELRYRTQHIDRHYMEWHRKFTLSIACLLLFFVGAPMGAIIRKGGLGMPVIVSVGFFILFYMLSITGEKLIKEGSVEPWYGMWFPIFWISPIAIFLTYKAATDSVILDSEFYRILFTRLKKFVFFPFKKLIASF
jgi:lipopolysaccharide export system permease protein